jgi:iron complex outermembrane recepter protein
MSLLRVTTLVSSVVLSLNLIAPASSCLADEPQPVTTATETVQVTATRVAEDVEVVPASVTVVTGESLRARNVTDLAGALALTAGVNIAPGGDSGPAGSVPSLWGLREFDAFLLVVDGVPWGGAFNPALTSLDLTDVDRIEVLRGAAPVMYGATSFVGVIHVIHRQAGSEGGTAKVAVGSYSSGAASVAMPLPKAGGYRESLSVSGEKQGFKDDHTSYTRGQALYRGAITVGAGTFHLDLGATMLRQKPASPSPRSGKVLDPLVPVDSNQNPRGSKVDEDRLALVAGWDTTLGKGTWSTTLSFTHTHRSSGRGLLAAVSEDDPNAHGFRQHLGLTDIYFDSHITIPVSSTLSFVAGVDHLYGSADSRSEDFDYFASLDGTNVQSINDLAAGGRVNMKDTRNFSGLFAQAEWTPVSRLHILVGGRLNRTAESMSVNGVELSTGATDHSSDSRTTTRGTGTIGASLMLWSAKDNAVWLWADYRNAFKPAALDFGPDAEGSILAAETSTSAEVGFKGRHGDGRFEWELAAFQMDFDNLVIPVITPGGQPGIANAGKERFKGIEAEVDLRLLPDLYWQTAYSYHDARFRNYIRDFDGEPMQLEGKMLEMSPRDMASTGIAYTPGHGVNGNVLVSWIGEYFLNMRNTAVSPAYTTWSAGLGYRFSTWEIRVDGQNLSDSRAPVAESELGDAQYYRMPARTFRLSALLRF